MELEWRDEMINDQPKKCIMLCHTIDFWNISSKITLVNITDK